MADVSSRQLRELLFEPAQCQFNGKLMRILQHSQVLVSLFFDSRCIDMRMPARSAVHYSRPLCPKRLDTSTTLKSFIFISFLHSYYVSSAYTNKLSLCLSHPIYIYMYIYIYIYVYIYIYIYINIYIELVMFPMFIYVFVDVPSPACRPCTWCR